jgi:hypothetical protein
MDPLAFTNHAEVEPISLFGAGNAGVIARASRLFRRDDDSRSESYSDILRRAGLPAIEGQGNGAADQAAHAARIAASLRVSVTPCSLASARLAHRRVRNGTGKSDRHCGYRHLRSDKSKRPLRRPDPF